MKIGVVSRFQKFRAAGIMACALALSACHKSSSPVTPTTTTTTTVTTSSVAVSGEPMLTGIGQRSQYTATATLSDGTTPDVTRSTTTTWSSSNTAVAVISSSGVVTTIADGATTLTATYQGVSGTQDLTIRSVTTTFRGTVAQSDGRRGTFALTIRGAVTSASAPTSAPLSGAFQVTAGEVVALTGFYAAYTGMVSFTGFSGGGLTFSGSIANGALTGTYTGPNGITGTFSSQTSTIS
jgi:hypothetical protein